MHRRHFLRAGAALAAAAAAPRLLSAQACAPTLADRYGEGPFYLPGAPRRTQVSRATEPGEKLSISGVASNCRGPLAGLKVELWHATHSGCYIHPAQSCDQVPGNDTQARLWAHLVTDAEGRYAFDTIKPGRYLNGARYRPSHIHFKFITPGSAGGRDTVHLTTQLYFQGDEYIRGDYAADHASAATRIIPLAREGAAPWRGTWNIDLPDVPSGLRGDVFQDPALLGFDVAIRRIGWRMLFQLPPLPPGRHVELRLFAADGSLVRRSLHASTPIEVDITFLPRGRYLAEFRWHAPQGPRLEKTTFLI